VVLGVDAHKRTHTVVAVDQLGRKLGERTTGTTSQDHLTLLRWAEQFGQQRLWAVEDCRHLSRRLERDLLSAGERIVRVPTKLMAHARDAARSYGKSDQLPAAQLEGPGRQVRLLVDHRDNLVAERTRAINRLRWHLHELDPSWQPPARTLWRPKHLQAILDRLAGVDGLVARLARRLVERCHQLAAEISAVDKELEVLVRPLAPALLEVCGCATITAARLVGRPPMSAGSDPGTPMPDTTGPRRCPSGRATAFGTGSAGPATGSSTPRSTASPSPRPTTIATPARSLNAAAPPATPRPSRSAPLSVGAPTSSIGHCSSTPSSTQHHQLP
jgi:transposase